MFEASHINENKETEMNTNIIIRMKNNDWEKKEINYERRKDKMKKLNEKKKYYYYLFFSFNFFIFKTICKTAKGESDTYRQKRQNMKEGLLEDRDSCVLCNLCQQILFESREIIFNASTWELYPLSISFSLSFCLSITIWAMGWKVHELTLKDWC